MNSFPFDYPPLEAAGQLKLKDDHLQTMLAGGHTDTVSVLLAEGIRKTLGQRRKLFKKQMREELDFIL